MRISLQEGVRGLSVLKLSQENNSEKTDALDKALGPSRFFVCFLIKNETPDKIEVFLHGGASDSDWLDIHRVLDDLIRTQRIQMEKAEQNRGRIV